MKTKIVNKGYINSVLFGYSENLLEIKYLESVIFAPERHMSPQAGIGLPDLQALENRLSQLRKETTAVEAAIEMLRRRNDAAAALAYFDLVYAKKKVNMTGAVFRLESLGLTRYSAEQIARQLHYVVAQRLGFIKIK